MAAATETSMAAGEGLNRGKSRFATIALLACAVVGAIVGYNSFDTNGSLVENNVAYSDRSAVVMENPTNADASSPSTSRRRRLTGMERLLETEPQPQDERITKEDVLVEKIANKLKPSPLLFYSDEEMEELDIHVSAVKKRVSNFGKKDVVEDTSPRPRMKPHQFLHLHHMKTGGTSIDRLLRCSMDRLKRQAHYDVPYYSIHECSRNRFTQCLNQTENACRPYMKQAAVMSYCAALKYLEEFGWWHNGNEENSVKAFTVLRHPVDRVWSMYRFQTKNCYQCIPLKEIYEKIDNDEDTGLDALCLDQIRNHEVNNLLSTEFPLKPSEIVDTDNNDEHADVAERMVQESIDNMKNFFTIIGITEHLPETASLIGTVFPWMDLDGKDEYGTTSQCQLPHANASPKNNRCGEQRTHLPLPDQPDQETYDLIVKHNNLDMQLYEAAVAYFDLQQKAMALNE